MKQEQYMKAQVTLPRISIRRQNVASGSKDSENEEAGHKASWAYLCVRREEIHDFPNLMP